MRSDEKSLKLRRTYWELSGRKEGASSSDQRTAPGIFADALELLPTSLRLHAHERLIDCGRLERDYTSWGSHGFELVCDSLQAGTDRTFQLRRLWNLLYSYSIFFDDLIDLWDASCAKDIIICDLVLDGLHAELCRFDDEKGHLIDSFQRYRSESVSSINAEFQTRSLCSALSAESFDLILGRKAALIKFFADAVSYYNARRVCTKYEINRFDSLCTAVQIMDDLTDIDVDVASGRMNSIALFIHSSFPGILDFAEQYKGDAIRAALIVTGRYEAMLRRAEEHLQRFYQTYSGNESLTSALVASTLGEIRKTRHSIAHYRMAKFEQCETVREAISVRGDCATHNTKALEEIVKLAMIVRDGVRAAN